MSDKCERCGKVGQDRRTLWMACFYAMDELRIPLEEKAIHGTVCSKIGERSILKSHGLDHTVSVFSDPSGDPKHRPFYTMLVCKRCRGEWMEAIGNWFLAAPQGRDNDADEPEDSESSGSGVFIRELGVTREISEEKWEENAN